MLNVAHDKMPRVKITPEVIESRAQWDAAMEASVDKLIVYVDGITPSLAAIIGPPRDNNGTRPPYASH